MKNETARREIESLDYYLQNHTDDYSEESHTAMMMAVKALEAQTCIEDYPTCTECEHYDSEKHYCPRFCQVIKDTLAEAQPTDADCISRDSLNDAISELTYWHFEDGRLVVGGGGIKYETVYKVDDVVRIPDILPPVTPQFTDEEIDKAQAVEQAYVDKMVELAVEESKSPKGKWIRVVDKAGHWVWECEDCKWQQRIATNFCPDCGADMSGGETDADSG